MSALNEAQFANKLDMSVITDTSHSPMAGEHTPTDDEDRHAFTVVTNSALVNGLYADATDNGHKYNTIIHTNEHLRHIIYIHLHTQKNIANSCNFSSTKETGIYNHTEAVSYNTARFNVRRQLHHILSTYLLVSQYTHSHNTTRTMPNGKQGFTFMTQVPIVTV